MQVMKTGNESTQVLVGKTAGTATYGVSNDPMMMSMLSTGFYGNPLRTSIQEVLFNAWDAHKMGNCTDKPIEVTISESAGLVIRDFGPGISKEDMIPIYCIYGASTKREDSNATGGFGLGSKSPYAYTDSFTVVSHHNGVKSMYLAQRSCEENNGGPGLTTIMSDVPTDETGLMVSIPLKTINDMMRTERYIHELMWKSGIRLQLTIENSSSDPMCFDNPTPPYNTYFNGSDMNADAELMAIYGGVRYPIHSRDEYEKEFNMLSDLSSKIGTFYFSFPPDTLCPLPNREGLNFNSQTIEHILVQMEIAMESINELMEPAIDMVMHGIVQQLKDNDVPPEFITHALLEAGAGKQPQGCVHNGTGLHHLISGYPPEGANPDMWKALVRIVLTTTKLPKYVKGGFEGLNKIKIKALNTFFPNEAYKFRKYIVGGRNLVDDYWGKWVEETTLTAYRLTKALKIKKPIAIRLKDRGWGNSRWDVLNGGRNHAKGNVPYLAWELSKKIKQDIEDNRKQTAAEIRTDRLYNHREGQEENSRMMMHKKIVIAETAAALNESYVETRGYFNAKKGRRGYEISDFGGHGCPFPAFIVGVGKLEKARTFLEGEGYTIVKELHKPKPKTELLESLDGKGNPAQEEVVIQKPKTLFWPLRPSSNRWVEQHIDVGVEYSKTFINVTETALDDYYNRENRCSSRMLRHIKKNWPETIVVFNKNQNGKLERKGASHVSVRIRKKTEKLLNNKERLERLYLHYYAQKHGDIPSRLLRLPEFQKLLQLPYLRTKEKEEFMEDLQFLDDVKDERCTDIVSRDLRNKILRGMSDIKCSPKLVQLEKVSKQLHILDGYHLDIKLKGMKPGEVKVFSEKLMRFLRTI